MTPKPTTTTMQLGGQNAKGAGHGFVDVPTTIEHAKANKWGKCEKCGVEYGLHPDELGHYFVGKPMNSTTIETAEWEKQFDELIQCIHPDCDRNGNIPHQVGEDEWEPEQCQYCYEFRLPAKQFIKDHSLALLREVSEQVIGDDEKFPTFNDELITEIRGRKKLRTEQRKALSTLIKKYEAKTD